MRTSPPDEAGPAVLRANTQTEVGRLQVHACFSLYPDKCATAHAHALKARGPSIWRPFVLRCTGVADEAKQRADQAVLELSDGACQWRCLKISAASRGTTRMLVGRHMSKHQCAQNIIGKRLGQATPARLPAEDACRLRNDGSGIRRRRPMANVRLGDLGQSEVVWNHAEVLAAG